MRSLIIVDLQNDFCPGGALAVPEGDQVVPLVNRLLSCFDLIVATQDWHPPNHGSFAVNHPGLQPGQETELHGLKQILWPVHCVQGTAGAQLVDRLHGEAISRVFKKGTDPRIDSYSGFFDNAHLRATGLQEYLEEQHVDRIYLVGLATDYCVKYTALDARSLGFETFVIVDACRGVNLSPGDVKRALEEMKAAGVKIIHGTDLLGDG